MGSVETFRWNVRLGKAARPGDPGIATRHGRCCSLIIGLLLPARQGFAHFGLGIDTEGVGDAIDVIEVGDGLDRVQDVAVGKAVPAECIEILRPSGSGRASDELGELGEGFLAGRKLGAAIAVLDVLGQLGVACFLTEILSVRLDSIKAAVGPGDDRGEELALGAGKTRLTAHGREVELHRGAQRRGIQALHFQDVEDFAGAPHGLLVFALQFARGFGGLDGFDPGHGGRLYVSLKSIMTGLVRKPRVLTAS
jgi:hypothetical protein